MTSELEKRLESRRERVVLVVHPLHVHPLHAHNHTENCTAECDWQVVAVIGVRPPAPAGLSKWLENGWVLVSAQPYSTQLREVLVTLEK